MLDLKIYFISILTIISSLLTFGFIGGAIHTVFKKKYSNEFIALFFYEVIGMMLCISGYAIYKTHGITLLLPIPLLIIIYLKSDKTPDINNYNFKRLLFPFYYLIFAAIAYWLFFIQTFSSSTDYISYAGGDNIAYGRFAEYLNFFGRENIGLDYIYPDRFTLMPYHYGDLWITALASKVIGVNSTIVLVIIVYPLLAGIAVVGMSSILSHSYSKSQYSQIVSLVLGFAIILVSALSSLNPAKFIGANNLTNSMLNSSKLILVFVFILAMVILLKQKSLFNFFVICSISVLNFINILPPIFLLASFLFVYLFIIKKEKNGKKGYYIFFSTIFYILIFYKFGPLLFEKSELYYKNQEFTLDGTKYVKTAFNIIAGGSLQLFPLLLFFIPLLARVSKNWKNDILDNVRLEYLMILVLTFCGLFSWAILHPITTEAVQFFYNIYIPITAFVIIIILNILLNSKNRILIFLGILLLVISVAPNLSFKSHVSKISKTDYNSMLNYSAKHGYNFVNLISTKHFKSLFNKNTVIYPPLGILSYFHSPVINLSINAPYIVPDSTSSMILSTEKNLINMAPYTEFMRRQKRTFISDTIAPNTFISMHNIKNIILQDTSLPSNLKHLIKDSLILSDGTRIYSLK